MERTYIYSIGGVVLLFFILIFGSEIYRTYKIDVRLETTHQELILLKETVEKVASDVEVLERANSALDARFGEEIALQREQFDEEKENLTSQLGELSSALDTQSEQLDTIAASETSLLVAQWQPYVYRLVCHVDGEKSKGSATLENSNNRWRLVTSAHVLEENGVLVDSCDVRDQSGRFLTQVTGSDMSYDNETGIGILKTSELDTSELAVPQVCEAEPIIGDRVITLGYPGIGADDSVTVTEGIISGFDDDFYVTSAKIEEGNSGGVAVHVKDNCILGLPTLVITGRVESLARILPL